MPIAMLIRHVHLPAIVVVIDGTGRADDFAEL